MEQKEIVIDNITEFIEIALREKDRILYHPHGYIETVYRGQINKDWQLAPGLLRNTPDSTIREKILHETLYLNEFIRQMNKECRNLDFFDIMVKAQHYGIPTRLLDVTLNPLVALFFACNDAINIYDEGKIPDGAVYIFKNSHMYYQNSYYIQVITYYIFKYRWKMSIDSNPEKIVASEEIKENIRLSQNILEQDLLNNVKDLDMQHNPKHIGDILNSNRNYFILPKLSNERIRAQQGAFILFCDYLRKHHGALGKWEDVDFNEKDFVKKSIKLIIKGDKKKKILHDLESLGISYSTLFPEMEYHARDIVKRININNKKNYEDEYK